MGLLFRKFWSKEWEIRWWLVNTKFSVLRVVLVKFRLRKYLRSERDFDILFNLLDTSKVLTKFFIWFWKNLEIRFLFILNIFLNFIPKSINSWLGQWLYIFFRTESLLEPNFDRFEWSKPLNNLFLFCSLWLGCFAIDYSIQNGSFL